MLIIIWLGFIQVNFIQHLKLKFYSSLLVLLFFCFFEVILMPKLFLFRLIRFGFLTLDLILNKHFLLIKVNNLPHQSSNVLFCYQHSLNIEQMSYKSINYLFLHFINRIILVFLIKEHCQVIGWLIYFCQSFYEPYLKSVCYILNYRSV